MGHYCMPGPIDTWTLFLFNALLRLSALSSAETDLHHSLKKSEWWSKGSNYLFEGENSVGELVREINTYPNKWQENDLLRSWIDYESAVFVVRNGSRHAIPDEEWFLKEGFNWSDIK